MHKYLAALGSPAHDTGRPRLLVCWPSAKMNKYQALLYSRAFEHGFAMHGISRLTDLAEISWPGEVVFHAHWFATLFASAQSEEDGARSLSEAIATIEAFSARTGARLVWTAHNVFPHNTLTPAASLELRRWIVRRFDAIHIHAEAHGEILEAAYDLPLTRSFVVPHMSYDGGYPIYISRPEARELLSIRPSQFVFLFFGSMQRYKGLEGLVLAFQQLADAGADDALLIIAGMPSDPSVPEALRSIAAGNERIRIDARRIADDDVQIFCNAADAMVLPYADGLNSGVAFLGLTFGLDVIGPAVPAFRAIAHLGVRCYDQTQPDALRDMLIETCKRGGAAMRPARNPDVDQLSPSLISSKFFAELHKVMTSGANEKTDEAFSKKSERSRAQS